MPRETIETKALRYLAEGRLHVYRVHGGVVEATCHGTDLYHLGFDGRDWSCTCAAYGRCAHLLALELVTVATP